MPPVALDKLLSFTHKLRETQDPTVSLGFPWNFLLLTGCCFIFLEFSAFKNLFFKLIFLSLLLCFLLCVYVTVSVILIFLPASPGWCHRNKCQLQRSTWVFLSFGSPLLSPHAVVMYSMASSITSVWMPTTLSLV